MLRNSFRARLILGAAVWISVGIVVSGFALSHLFRELVTRQIDHDLSDHAEELRALAEIDAEGRLSIPRQLSDPRFLLQRSGMYWTIERLNGESVGSPSLGESHLPLGSVGETSSRFALVETALGTLRMNQQLIRSPRFDDPLRIGVGVETRAIDNELAHLNRTLAVSLGIIALGLIGAATIQVTFGLLPLTRVRSALVAVRTGKAQRLPDDLPHEVAPLARDLNSMIAANNQMIKRARAQAGTLAHGLKTALAVLMDEAYQLKTTNAEAAGVIEQQCQQMQRHIDYQMARARAAGRGTTGAAVAIVPAVRVVISALSRLHQDRRLALVCTGPDDLLVACDPQDFSEIIGNLADNAAKWARSRVLISVAPDGDNVSIKVEDDGPGIPAESREIAFGLGEKLDERRPGAGLGLAITRELVTLYGGRVWLDRSVLGGVSACLTLPAGSIG